MNLSRLPIPATTTLLFLCSAVAAAQEDATDAANSGVAPVAAEAGSPSAGGGPIESLLGSLTSAFSKMDVGPKVAFGALPIVVYLVVCLLVFNLLVRSGRPSPLAANWGCAVGLSFWIGFVFFVWFAFVAPANLPGWFLGSVAFGIALFLVFTAFRSSRHRRA